MAITPASLYSDDFAAIGSVRTDGTIPERKNTTSFDTLLNAAVDMYKEADSLQKAAEASEMSFALGYTDSIHDVANAQRKASISLQYTVRVTNAVVSAYKELMNLQL